MGLAAERAEVRVRGRGRGNAWHKRADRRKIAPAVH
jgi:hypothetical protein